MKFLSNRSLKDLGVFCLIAMALVFVVEYFGIRHQIQALEEAERKIDFARELQVNTQQIALQSQLYLQGNRQIASDISTKIEYLDHQLHTLAEGGRIDETSFFIGPLSRLPRITFNNLNKSWDTYKTAVIGIILPKDQAPPSVQSDSTMNLPAVTPATSEAEKIIHEAKWLSLSDWFSKLVKDLEEEAESKQHTVVHTFVAIMIVDLLLLALLLYGFVRKVINPIQQLETNIINHTHTNVTSSNEIGKITHEVNEIIDNLKDATDFVTAIGEGKLDLDYKQTLEVDYTPGKNKLADSLIQMQEKLKALNEAERKRQWANEGITKFVEIMRSANDNLTTLGDAVISALVQYTNSNQGALYILNDEDTSNKHLELVSLFAFDLKKYQQQKIKLGEGILGQTFLEKETTHLTNMPDEYIKITSGLGDANPKALLLFPLKVDKEAYGIIELASFQEFQPHEIEFVEKLGESIAATLASVRGAQKNRQLIEQFQQQTEEMRAQEEEMRQNMEELQATQEEVARKELVYIERIRELENKVKHSDSGELELLREKSARMERELQLKIDALTTQLSSRHSDDWAVAEDVEKALRMNLDAIKIAQEELNKKAR